jgi:tetratricopeptide (TPR) repeat protein
MDEKTLLTLIAEGESYRLDFKRELDLNSSENRAEFVKDILALANSASTSGYLVIGVEDDKKIVGSNIWSEEQVQQIAHTYITPAVRIHCSFVSLAELKIGVIEVVGDSKPHKIARALGKLNQDEVFLRRGSIVSKASPEEIIEMYHADTQRREAARDISAAQAHLKIANYESAIAAYSRAIEIMPTVELFLARSEARQLLLDQVEKSIESTMKGKPWAEVYRAREELVTPIVKSIYDDLSKAVRLATSSANEKSVRQRRYQFGQKRPNRIYSWEQQREDFDWLRSNTSGRERGELIYHEVNKWEVIDNTWEVGVEVVALMDEAIQNEYTEPQVFFLRALGHKLVGNYELGLRDIDTGLSKLTRTDETRREQVDFLCERADLLVRINRFDEAHKTLLEAKTIDKDELRSYLNLMFGIEDNLLCLSSLYHEFSGSEIDEPMVSAVKILALWEGRHLIRYNNEKSRTDPYTALHALEKRCPNLMANIEAILGSNLWQAMLNDDPNLSFTVGIPRLK